MLLEDPDSFKALTSRFRFRHVDAETTISGGSSKQKDCDDLGEGMDEDGGAVLNEFQGQISDTVTTLVSAIDKCISTFDQTLFKGFKILKMKT